jgi:hypothetical protein
MKTSNVDSLAPARSPLPERQCSPSSGFPARRIQRPTPNVELRTAELDVRCSALGVGCLLHFDTCCADFSFISC